MGSAVGGFMSGAGHEVTLVGRAPHMEAVRRDGLRVTGIWGRHHFQGINAHTEADDLPSGTFDMVFLTVKSYDTPKALDLAESVVDKDTVVCCYQNGLGNMEKTAERFGWSRTAGARTIYGVRVTEPGAIEITVIANPTALGVPRPEGPAGKMRVMAGAMQAAGLPTVFTDRIETVLWAKVAYNCALNPLSALLDANYGKLPEIPQARAMMDTIIDELYAVAAARSVTLEPSDPEAYRDLFYSKLVPPTAAHYASMHEDFRRRRRTEIDALNGAIARMGAESGIACPVNTFLTDLVHAREAAMGAG